VVEREIPALWCILKAIRSIRVGVKIFFIFSTGRPRLPPSNSTDDLCSENGPRLFAAYPLQHSIFFRGTGTEETRPHAVHMNDFPYDDPVLRSNSPSNSLSTEYGPDETTQAEKELTAAEFTCRVDSTHRFHVAREAELVAEQSPLLPPLNQGDEKDEKGEYSTPLLG
jgi:hypothetical protein